LTDDWKSLLGGFLQDLMNPLVAPHIQFIPEESHGRNIYKTSQLAKWLKYSELDL
jgi:hypothetical protein